jgi:hypothetical protein
MLPRNDNIFVPSPTSGQVRAKLLTCNQILPGPNQAVMKASRSSYKKVLSLYLRTDFHCLLPLPLGRDATQGKLKNHVR